MKYFFLLIFLLSCSSVPQPQAKVTKEESVPDLAKRREEFLGYWIGEMTTKDGKFMRWLVERRVDGNFTLTHVIKDSVSDPRKFDPEKATYELGIWGVSGDIYFTATRQYFENKKVNNFDTTQAGLYDAYKVLSFDGTKMTYMSFETGETFTMVKVPKGDKLEL